MGVVENLGSAIGREFERAVEPDKGRDVFDCVVSYPVWTRFPNKYFITESR